MKPSQHKRWVVAVDGGGSKIAIAAQLCSDDAPPPDSLEAARLWTFAHCGSAHPTTWDTARQHLAEALQTVCHALALSEAGCPVRHVLFALAGAGREADRAKVLDWARRLEPPLNCSSIACSSDIEPLIDYRHVSWGKRGDEGTATSVAVILGTGSIVATRDGNRRIVRAGGWGPNLGDECSGGALGIAALRSVTDWLDAGTTAEKASPLVAAVLAALPGRDDWMRAASGDASLQEALLASDVEIDRDKLAGLIIETAADRAAAATLAPAVLELAFEKGDADARRLLKPQLERLSWQIEQVVRRAGLDSAGFELVFSGGLATHYALLRGALVDACKARDLFPRDAVVAEPLLAALRLAFRDPFGS